MGGWNEDRIADELDKFLDQGKWRTRRANRRLIYEKVDEMGLRFGHQLVRQLSDTSLDLDKHVSSMVEHYRGCKPEKHVSWAPFVFIEEIMNNDQLRELKELDKVFRKAVKKFLNPKRYTASSWSLRTMFFTPSPFRGIRGTSTRSRP